MTATQAPTPGPLSGDDVNRDCKACGAFQPDLNAACTFCGIAPTAPVEASGSEREDWKQRLADIQIGRSVDDVYSTFPFPKASFRGDIGHALSALRPQPSGETQEWSQEQHDHEALTTIAEHLRDNPAAPYSGRQCEEFVLSARDAFLSTSPLALGGQHSGGEGEQ